MIIKLPPKDKIREIYEYASANGVLQDVERSISSKFGPFPDRAKCIGTDLYDCRYVDVSDRPIIIDHIYMKEMS